MNSFYNKNIAAGLTLGVCLAAAAGVQAAVTMDGVWQVSKPVSRLKTKEGKTPPLLPAAQQLYDQRTAQFEKGDRSYDSTLWCKPMGEPRTAFDPEGGIFEIRINPKVVLFDYTWNRMVRWITVSNEDVDVIGPAYYGTSNAQWEGATLVVDAQGFHQETMLDAAGMPHSDQLQMMQRFTLKNNGNTLEETIRFEDPATFSRPWETVVEYQRLPDDTLIPEDVCLDRRGITDY